MSEPCPQDLPGPVPLQEAATVWEQSFAESSIERIRHENVDTLILTWMEGGRWRAAWQLPGLCVWHASSPSWSARGDAVFQAGEDARAYFSSRRGAKALGRGPSVAETEPASAVPVIVGLRSLADARDTAGDGADRLFENALRLAFPRSRLRRPPRSS